MVLEQYSEKIKKIVASVSDSDFLKALDLIAAVDPAGRKILLIGNGGSAAICSHLAVDFTKAAKIKAINFADSSLLTCFANDYGYDSAYEEMISVFAEPGDVLIAISSSGKSKNIVNAAVKARKKQISVITLSGFDRDNALCKLGSVNFHVDSDVFNIVENAHEQILLALCDCVRMGEAKFREWIGD